ncbi:hypothetical protein [Oceanirhabdus sp. W0125-5]|uniref:hypothetical protein n=1 Tax=Oceanirhabdus sp. W0125-5 TaxID=2999116 RepID=UPI0022F33138|nr:hypothetical protein [Oceanirhabdus sp. W0125-5]WBW99207.1 hypothetical protein OW730_10795 [Oceanirhabdus sp. W0125-5]
MKDTIGFLNENDVLINYIHLMKSDKIDFLKGKEQVKIKIKYLIEELMDCEDIHGKINVASKLWKLLFEVSMSFIDKNKDGYDRLFEYFDKFIEFEELIFASDSFYRDHTLHVLWVYFLGEYIFYDDEFEGLVKGAKKSFKNMDFLGEVELINDDGYLDDLIKNMKEIIQGESLEASVRCVSALTHDLGYPLKKITKINNSIDKILRVYGFNDVKKMKLSFNISKLDNIRTFLDSLSSMVTLSNYENEILNRYSPNEVNESLSAMKMRRNKKGGYDFIGIDIEKYKKLSDKNKRIIKEVLKMDYNHKVDLNKQIIYSKNFEEYEHGIISAYILFENLEAFKDLGIISVDKKISANRAQNKQVREKLNIMSAITNHTSSDYKITGISDISAFLAFIDEIEEFSRISRANQNRQFVDEFCKTKIYMENEWFNVDFIFDNESISSLNPERAFKGRCKKMLSLLDVNNLMDNFKLNLRCIGRLPNDKNIYKISIQKGEHVISINGERVITREYLNSMEF